MNAPHEGLSYLDRAQARRDLSAAGLMPGGEAAKRRLEDAEEADLLKGDGWHVVSIKGGNEEGGVTSHRGVLHPDEYVDPSVLLTLVENELGFTIEQVRSVYRQGPLTDARRELRGRIDVRLLSVAEAGGNMLELAKMFGWSVEAAGTTGGERCKTMERAVERARMEREAA